MAFGGVAVDALGVTDGWPSASMLTGLFGNALGYQRTDAASLQRLQDRLFFAARRDLDGERMTDFQTAEIAHADQGWTTRGAPEGRAGGAGSYQGQHRRWRDYWADRCVMVAARLFEPFEAPTIDDLASGLDQPVRPLFLGRKSCPPACRLFAGFVEAPDAVSALTLGVTRPVIALWPASEPGPGLFAERSYYGRRDWRSGVHGGESHWREGRLPVQETRE